MKQIKLPSHQDRKLDGKIPYNDGNPLRDLTTTFHWETFENTQVNSLGHSNNVKYWEIRG